MKITKIIERHHAGCFTVEDDKGNQYLIQLAHKIEAIWQENH